MQYHAELNELREKIEKENKENQARNERLLERIRNEFVKSDPTGLDLVKLKLYEEQGGVCAYSLKQMSLEHLFDADYTEVDHKIGRASCRERV